VQYNWNWGIFWQPAPDGTGVYFWWLISGLGWTLSTALLAWAIALALGAAIGTLRTTPVAWVVRLGNAYVEIFRNIPLLVQMFLWYFVLPELLPKALGDAMKQMVPPWASFWPAVLCLGFYTSARVAEQERLGRPQRCAFRSCDRRCRRYAAYRSTDHAESSERQDGNQRCAGKKAERAKQRRRRQSTKNSPHREAARVKLLHRSVPLGARDHQ